MVANRGRVQRIGHRATQRETVPEPRTKWDESTPNDWALSRQAQTNLRAINRAPEIVGRLYARENLQRTKAAENTGKNDITGRGCELC